MRSLVGISIALTMAVLSACSKGAGDASAATDSVASPYPDTLRVATLYSPMSYFIYREEAMGYDYTLVNEFAQAKGMELDLEIATSLQHAIAMLDSGKVDLIAYEVPVTAEYQRKVLACGPENTTWQVLVQNVADTARITDVTQLVGRDVWVERDSKYQYRLQNLDQELGGGIRIHPIDRDTLIGEDLIEMVSRGEVPLTVVDSDIARLNRTYFSNVDITVQLSFGQRSAWAVAPRNKWLADSVSAWFEAEGTRRENETLLKRYFELSKASPVFGTFDFSKGKISPYDDLFKKYAKEIGWDWRLIAAQCYVESQFRNDVVSWAGARGIMQIMPSTARANGVSPDMLTNPETSIRIACKILEAMDKMMARYVSDKNERHKFAVAAYNSGGAHILDAIALARKYGKSASTWTGGVADALMMKSDERYYNDPVVKYGYFRGRQTTEYVRHVYDFYGRATKKIKA